MSSPASTPDRRRVFPIYARFAYPANGYQADKELAAKHLTPGRTYVIDHMDVGRSHTTIYLHGFPGTGFNSVQFAAAYGDDEDEPGQLPGECEAALLRDDNGLRLHVGLTQTGAAGVSVTEGMRATLICLSGERLSRFREALDRAATPGQAHEAEQPGIPDAAVMKLLHHAFFTGNPGASQGDWRRYCDLIGPGVAEKYAGDEEAVST